MRSRAILALTLAAAVLAGPGAVTAQPWLDDPVRIVTLSNRADLISGGDALVEIVLPERADPATVTVAVDGREVTEAFAVRDDGRFYGRIDRMTSGVNRVTATLGDGTGAYLDITNHPIGGPVFSGPQVQPWICNTEAVGLAPPEDAQCNAPTRYEFHYKNAASGQFEPYDPDNPPPAAQVATTTTDEGNTVRYIVRVEIGTQNRGIYHIAVLYDPAQGWEPWAPQPGWNQKLLYLFGGGCTPDHRQYSDSAFAENVSVLNDMALSRGFATATSTMNVLGQNCSDITSGETVMMVKERLIEAIGPLRHTIGDGCSGGSIQQHQIANNYPGLLDAIQPCRSFPDIWSLAGEVGDCELLVRYFNEVSPHLWADPDDRAAVGGSVDAGTCTAWTEAFALPRAVMDPTTGCVGLELGPEHSVEPIVGDDEPEWVYHPDDNPTGARCTVQDFTVATLGRRPPEVWGPVEQQIGQGFANRPYDNVGVQYGLAALLAGDITPAQFIDLNDKIGGLDIDMGWQSERAAALPDVLEIAYRTGRVTDGWELAKVPIIDMRGSSNHEIHTDYHTWAMRERLLAANGHIDNHVHFVGSIPTQVQPPMGEDSLVAIDAWMAAIEADDSALLLHDKVVRNRPPDLVDACYIVPGAAAVTDRTTCASAFPYFGSPRIVAGGPLSSDVLKCQLQPLDRADYPVTFTDDEWSRLQAAFPDGVCDWTHDSVGYQPSVPWLTYEHGPGGRALGEAPVSVPFGPQGPAALVTRHGGAGRVETAVAVSGLVVDRAHTVVVARADDHADALVGGPLAVQLGAPLLLTSPDELTQAAAEEVVRLGAREAVLLGGEAALSPAVAEALTQAGLAVRRVAGPTRYGTAAAIAEAMSASGSVLMARGDAFPDALAASGLGAATGVPVLLTMPDGLPAETAAALQAGTDVTIVGGEAAVGAAAAAAVDGAAGEVTRLAGATRYATSAVVADAALAAGVTPDATWIATGRDFPDALVAGAAAGRDAGVLVLIDGADLAGSPETRDWLAAHGGGIAHMRIAGGTAAISPAVQGTLRALLAPG